MIHELVGSFQTQLVFSIKKRLTFHFKQNQQLTYLDSRLSNGAHLILGKDMLTDGSPSRAAPMGWHEMIGPQVWILSNPPQCYIEMMRWIYVNKPFHIQKKEIQQTNTCWCDINQLWPPATLLLRPRCPCSSWRMKTSQQKSAGF